MKITPLLTKCVELPSVSKNRLYGNSKFTVNIDTSSFDIRTDYGDLIFSLEILDMPACCGIEELGIIIFHQIYSDELSYNEVD
jgi:hypothetical protein